MYIPKGNSKFNFFIFSFYFPFWRISPLYATKSRNFLSQILPDQTKFYSTNHYLVGLYLIFKFHSILFKIVFSHNTSKFGGTFQGIQSCILFKFANSNIEISKSYAQED